MLKARIIALLMLLAGFGVGYFVYTTEHTDSRFKFRLGLDLIGGSHLVYRADTGSLSGGDIDDAMSALRDVIERRVNLFGVAEPIVQVERGSAVAGAGEENRLLVELPGVTNIEDAIAQIGKTPLLEFKLVDTSLSTSTVGYTDTGLTGRYLSKALLQFNQNPSGGMTNEPIVVLSFNPEGGKMFEEITKANVNRQLGIFLDGALLSSPVIREPITGGEATISGQFTAEEARDLVKNLNFGALPLPIELVGTETIGATLGAESLEKGIRAGVAGLIAVAIFMILWYRIPGMMATVALVIYVVLMLALFKLIPVTLTAAGIAGFILSIGMAVDANVIIFERLKEELRNGKNLNEATHDGFARAWLAIRDGHVTSIIAAVILFWFGTSLIQGFALAFGLGVIMSLFSAITLTRVFLRAIGDIKNPHTAKVLFGSGITLR